MKHIQYFFKLVIVSALCHFSPIVAQSNQNIIAAEFDVILRGGDVYDGSGAPSYRADIGLVGHYIAEIGDLSQRSSKQLLDINGLQISPGFINTLSWSGESLLDDGLGQSTIRQGVTLEVLGEGRSMGPITPAMRARMLEQQDYDYDISWRSLGEYLKHLQQRGISTNVASFVGASTVRTHVLGHSNRAPSSDELKQMQILVDEAMAEGALGVGAALIYAPGAYANTQELIALARRAAHFGGGYSAHIRSEGNHILQAVNETIQIAQQSNSFALIHHLKLAGRNNWHKWQAVVDKITQARKRNINIWADMYTYTAGSTGLDAAMPPWVQEGGTQAWVKRLQTAATRQRVITEMRDANAQWENLLLAAGAENTLLVGFRSPNLQKYVGRSLADVAKQRGESAEHAAIDLVIEDQSQVQVVYFLMSEDNVARTVQLPWISFASDARSIAVPHPENSESPHQTSGTHPRTYGNFARLLARYVRDEKRITLADAIHRMTQFPADNLNLKLRGQLKPGYYADLAIFDLAKVQDHASYEAPHKYSTGMVHVFVNGKQVLAHGKHTGATPGQIVRGPGWTAAP